MGIKHKLSAGLLAAALTTLAGVSASVSVYAESSLRPDDAARYDAAEEEAGFVEAVSFDGPSIRVNGTHYQFAPGAYVETRGIPSAPTLVTRGMNVYLRFLAYPDARRIVYLRQVADSAPTLAR